MTDTNDSARVAGELHHVQRPSTRIEQVLRPTSWRAALEALAENPDALPVSGGTDLVLDLARSSGPPVTLVDLSAVAGSTEITETETELVLAGGVTHNQVVADDRFRTHALPLAQACLEIGSPQLRNRATVAGNIATASPANDSISALMALNARVVVSRLDGDRVLDREINIAGFFFGFRSTVVARGELITAIRVPKLAAHERAIWMKLGLRRAQAISVVHAGMVVGVDNDTVTSARLALGSVAATVITSHVFPAALVGKQLDDASIGAAAAAVAASIEPIDDVRATADYRRSVTQSLIARGLAALAAGTEASQWPDAPPVLGIRRPSDEPPSRVVNDETVVSAVVNGRRSTGSSAASTTLLDWLRDHASAPCVGVKEGCAEGECGACTVLLDGTAVMSCLVPAAQVDGADVTTIEGLANDDRLHPLQQAFIDEFAVQCGFCIPGFLVAGAALLDERPHPSDEQIHLGLSGNLCRCTGYYPIAQAVRTVGGAS